VKDAEALQEYFDEMIERVLEGLVAKRPDSPYQAGARGFEWVKLKRSYQSKLRDTVDVVLVGYLRGRGKRAALGIGSLLGAVYDPARDRFRTVAKIGSGLSDSAWREIARPAERGSRPSQTAAGRFSADTRRVGGTAFGRRSAGRRDHAIAVPHLWEEGRGARLCPPLSPHAQRARGQVADGRDDGTRDPSDVQAAAPTHHAMTPRQKFP
jgi:hypothetical protein